MLIDHGHRIIRHRRSGLGAERSWRSLRSWNGLAIDLLRYIPFFSDALIVLKQRTHQPTMQHFLPSPPIQFVSLSCVFLFAQARDCIPLGNPLLVFEPSPPSLLLQPAQQLVISFKLCQKISATYLLLQGIMSMQETFSTEKYIPLEPYMFPWVACYQKFSQEIGIWARNQVLTYDPQVISVSKIRAKWKKVWKNPLKSLEEASS